MTLSILIPTYNYDCSHLVSALLAQLTEDCEIVVGDDCSTDKEISNRLSATLRQMGDGRLRLIRHERNLGSAGIRNLLCREAHGKWLLYIDGDAIIEDDRFVERYLKECDKTVVCGTVRHPDSMPSAQQSLRWRYEKRLEQRFSANEANKQPYSHFRTFHFLIPRNIMLDVPFNESIKSSGYEDLLFGKELAERGVRVRHIDITAVNGDIETNEVFLQKTERHMRTLHQLQSEIGTYSTLLNFHARLSACHLLWGVRWVYRFTKPVIRRNLLGSNPSIKLFQFYKLAEFCTI